jgi:membrane-associated protease RseP (regulator of RpoE activity)
MNLSGPLVWHPVFLASWIGLLVTSLNLVPAGQLDGGHILYSLSPRIHRVATRATIVCLFLLGIVSWLGWILWMGLLLLPGMRHPKVEDRTPLRGRRRILAPICLAILILTATPEPFQQANLLHTLHWLRR